ncbi:molybdopterin-synthase adenylyltransferase MoeB [Hyphobacterium sp. CCMP332]|nr:molybdopterin-synthase adenylyltransferase MoeB [Hyphobacterium sp. CCMP332]
MSLSKDEILRYSRQIILPEFGRESQEKLKNSSVLVVGAGGLGTPLLMYLAAAGIGTIGIVDFDIVDVSNLHRQVLYGTSDLGKKKSRQAIKKLKDNNPHINYKIFDEKLSSDNALRIFQNFDVIADGTDNFPTRYLVNDACVLTGKVNVFASIFQFEGQLSVFNYMGGPNYRDLFPKPPLPGIVPNCADGGVLGVLPGILGTMQALEVIKVLSGIGEPLSGKLLLVETKDMEFRKINIQKDTDNPISGKKPLIKELIDYEEFCGLKSKKMKSIDVQEFKKWKENNKEYQLFDVREINEHTLSNLGGQHLPMSEIQNSYKEIPKSGKVILYCKSGQRSATIIKFLSEKYAYDNLINLEGGITAWKNHFDPDLIIA